ncbi:pre-mRNA-splicing factor ATP-dependent RNA helicase [Salix suchowensis]|nr:pre-mRNA-splicing factor ATP-dependent RNA helicase [Salix suchowensis]
MAEDKHPNKYGPSASQPQDALMIRTVEAPQIAQSADKKSKPSMYGLSASQSLDGLLDGPMEAPQITQVMQSKSSKYNPQPPEGAMLRKVTREQIRQIPEAKQSKPSKHDPSALQPLYGFMPRKVTGEQARKALNPAVRGLFRSSAFEWEDDCMHATSSSSGDVCRKACRRGNGWYGGYAIAMSQLVLKTSVVQLGRQVGYSIRFEDMTEPGTTFLKYMTDGSRTYPCYRYSNGLLKALAKRRTDLKIIIMSATLDAVKFQKYFSLRSDTQAPLFKVPGRTHPVEIFYTQDPEPDYVEAAIRTVLMIHRSLIRRPDRLYTTLFVAATHATTAHLRPRPSCSWARLSAWSKSGCIYKHCRDVAHDRRHCLRRRSWFLQAESVQPRIRVESLLVSPISKASAQQRAGRAGRTRPGKCFRLYTEKDFMSQLEEQTYPEILRSNLSNTVLELVKLGIKDLVRFDYVDAPAPETLMRALELLNFLKALDDDGNLTPLGSMMAEFPLDPQYSFPRQCFICRALTCAMPNIWVRPANQRSQADAAKAFFTVPDGDHLTLLNVYNQYMQSTCTLSLVAFLHIYSSIRIADKFDKNWTWSNYVSGRALAQAENVRAQLQRNMERFELELMSISDEKKMFQSIRQALVCGFFMQVAHREGEKGSYLTVKDNQVVALHPSCGLDTQPEWVLFNEFVLTTRPYIRTVSEVRPEWLLEFAPSYFDLSSFPDGETKRTLQKVMNKKLGKSAGGTIDSRPAKKQKRVKQA